MKLKSIQIAGRAALLGLGVSTASAHISYSGRNFGILDGSDALITITNQTVTGSLGWADGTDADFGDSHKLRAFRFTLTNPSFVTVSVESIAFGTSITGLLPGFSIYSGLAHVAPITNAPDSADYDYSAISADYLASLGGVPKEGAFRALDDWRVGGDNQPGPVFDYDAPDGLSTFIFKDYAVDGTAANFGLTPGIVGDGVADGFVTKTFSLPAGDYSVFVGGADYAGNTTTGYGIRTTLAVPEPTAALMLLTGLGTLGLRRRRTP